MWERVGKWGERLNYSFWGLVFFRWSGVALDVGDESNESIGRPIRERRVKFGVWVFEKVVFVLSDSDLRRCEL